MLLVYAENEIGNRLFAFENYASQLYDVKGTIDKMEFESIAESFFRNYAHLPDPEAEKDHQAFIKQLGGD